MRAVRDIQEIRIAGRTKGRAQAFVQALPESLNALACTSTQEAVRGADIICTVTSSPTPVLQGDWLPKGVHINAVGASMPTVQEIDTSVLLKSRLFTDYRPSALAQAREIITAMAEGKIDKSHIRGEIGELLSGKVQGRRTPEDITLYRSLGIAAQDLICADFVRQKMQG